MNYRAVLVILIAQGSAPRDIVYTLCVYGLMRWQVDDLLRDSGVSLPMRWPADEITEERRHELQQLSMTE